MAFTGFFAVFAAVLCVLVLAMAGTAAAKSLYLINNHHTGQFDAWNINPGGTVTYQASNTLILVDTQANIRRIMQIIRALDEHMAAVSEVKALAIADDL